MKHLLKLFTLAAAVLLAGGRLAAQQPAPAQPPPTGSLADPSYRVAIGDSISINVREEPDMSISQRVDAAGQVRLPMAGEFRVQGMTLREIERALETLYQEKRLLRSPQVLVSVTDFAPRELSILGFVNNPGPFRFPPEVTEMDIVDLITKVGGFKNDAKDWEVSVTRLRPDGTEMTFTVNVGEMMKGAIKSRGVRKEFLVYPGDRIYVPQRFI